MARRLSKGRDLHTYTGFLNRVAPVLSTAFSQPMKIKPELIDRLVDRLLKNYRSKDLIVLKTDAATVKAKISEIIAQNFREEEAIEEEARKMLTAHAHDTRGIDHYKMFVLLKQKLAQKRGFIL
ncbi:MAG: DUF507 family protein [Candidatus Binatia bacterium]